MEVTIYEEARKTQSLIHLAKRDLIAIHEEGKVEVNGINVNDYGIKKQVLTIVQHAIKARIYDLEKQFSEL